MGHAVGIPITSASGNSDSTNQPSIADAGSPYPTIARRPSQSRRVEGSPRFVFTIAAS